MNVTPAQLEELISELRQVNEELADAARPLERLPDLNEDQRELIRTRILDGLARWTETTCRIHQRLGIPADAFARDEKP